MSIHAKGLTAFYRTARREVLCPLSEIRVVGAKKRRLERATAGLNGAIQGAYPYFEPAEGMRATPQAAFCRPSRTPEKVESGRG